MQQPPFFMSFEASALELQKFITLNRTPCYKLYLSNLRAYLQQQQYYPGPPVQLEQRLKNLTDHRHPDLPVINELSRQLNGYSHPPSELDKWICGHPSGTVGQEQDGTIVMKMLTMVCNSPQNDDDDDNKERTLEISEPNRVAILLSSYSLTFEFYRPPDLWILLYETELTHLLTNIRLGLSHKMGLNLNAYRRREGGVIEISLATDHSLTTTLDESDFYDLRIAITSKKWFCQRDRWTGRLYACCSYPEYQDQGYQDDDYNARMKPLKGNTDFTLLLHYPLHVLILMKGSSTRPLSIYNMGTTQINHRDGNFLNNRRSNWELVDCGVNEQSLGFNLNLREEEGRSTAVYENRTPKRWQRKLRLEPWSTYCNLMHFLYLNPSSGTSIQQHLNKTNNIVQPVPSYIERALLVSRPLSS